MPDLLPPFPIKTAEDIVGDGRSEVLLLLKRIADRLDQLNAGEDAEGMTPAEAARFLRISRTQIHQLSSRGLLPDPIELGDRCPRFLRSELRAWALAGSPNRARWRECRDAMIKRYG